MVSFLFVSDLMHNPKGQLACSSGRHIVLPGTLRFTPDTSGLRVTVPWTALASTFPSVQTLRERYGKDSRVLLVLGCVALDTLEALANPWLSKVDGDVDGEHCNFAYRMFEDIAMCYLAVKSKLADGSGAGADGSGAGGAGADGSGAGADGSGAGADGMPAAVMPGAGADGSGAATDGLPDALKSTALKTLYQSFLDTRGDDICRNLQVGLRGVLSTSWETSECNLAYAEYRLLRSACCMPSMASAMVKSDCKRVLLTFHEMRIGHVKCCCPVIFSAP